MRRRSALFESLLSRSGFFTHSISFLYALPLKIDYQELPVDHPAHTHQVSAKKGIRALHAPNGHTQGMHGVYTGMHGHACEVRTYGGASCGHTPPPSSLLRHRHHHPCCAIGDRVVSDISEAVRQERAARAAPRRAARSSTRREARGRGHRAHHAARTTPGAHLALSQQQGGSGRQWACGRICARWPTAQQARVRQHLAQGTVKRDVHSSACLLAGPFTSLLCKRA